MVGWVSNMVPMSPRHMYISYEVGNMRSRIQPLKKEGKEAGRVTERSAIRLCSLLEKTLGPSKAQIPWRQRKLTQLL